MVPITRVGWVNNGSHNQSRVGQVYNGSHNQSRVGV